jgi:hypothetical protein
MEGLMPTYPIDLLTSTEKGGSLTESEMDSNFSTTESSLNDLNTRINIVDTDLDNLAVADVYGLQTALDSKANSAHAHMFGDIAGMVTSGDGKKYLADDGTYKALECAEMPAFSTSEVLTGERWLDGRPIYQKTVSGGAVPVNTNKMVGSGISTVGIENLWLDQENSYAYGVQNGDKFSVPVNYTNSLTSVGLWTLIYDVNDTYEVQWSSNTDWSHIFQHSYFTFRYTKSADTANSPVATVVGACCDYPEQAGNAGKFLKTDGTSVSWETAVTDSPVDSVNGHTGAVVLSKSDIGLGSVDNTSDADKPVSTATQTALDAKANNAHAHVFGDVTGLATNGDGSKYLADDGTYNTIVNKELPGAATTEVLTAKRWIDDKPIYEIVIDLGALPDTTGMGSGAYYTNHLIPNYSACFSYVGIEAFAYDTTNDTTIPLPYCADPYMLAVFVSGANVTTGVPKGLDWSVYDKTYVTLRYTKSTDTASSPVVEVAAVAE